MESNYKSRFKKTLKATLANSEVQPKSYKIAHAEKLSVLPKDACLKPSNQIKKFQVSLMISKCDSISLYSWRRNSNYQFVTVSDPKQVYTTIFTSTIFVIC